MGSTICPVLLSGRKDPSLCQAQTPCGAAADQVQGCSVSPSKVKLRAQEGRAI